MLALSEIILKNLCFERCFLTSNILFFQELPFMKRLPAYLSHKRRVCQWILEKSSLSGSFVWHFLSKLIRIYDRFAKWKTNAFIMVLFSPTLIESFLLLSLPFLIMINALTSTTVFNVFFMELFSGCQRFVGFRIQKDWLLLRINLSCSWKQGKNLNTII